MILNVAAATFTSWLSLRKAHKGQLIGRACLNALQCSVSIMRGCVPFLGSFLLHSLYSKVTLKSQSFLRDTAVPHAQDV